MDRQELVRQLAATRWSWVVVAVLLAPVGLWARARRWWYLFPPESHPPGLMAAIMIGYMANNVLPLRAGEVVRVYVVARRWKGHFWLVVATLVVERVLDSLAIVLILAILVLIIPVPAILEWAAAVVLVIDVIGVAVLATLAFAPGLGQRVLVRITHRWPALERRATRVYAMFVRGLEGIRAPAHAAPLLAWTVLVWIFPALAAWSMLRAMNLTLPFLAGWTVLSFVGLGISIPSAPGYVGVFHAAAALALGIFGVAPAVAVGYALLYHASQFVPITLLGWIALLKEHVHLGEASRARPVEPV